MIARVTRGEGTVLRYSALELGAAMLLVVVVCMTA